MHLDQEQVQRLLHRELGSAEATVRGHLEICEDCRHKVIEAEQEEAWVLARLRGLDHPVPMVKPETLGPPRRRATRGYQRLAAGIFLALVAAGAAYALPGSPLPGVVHRIVELVRGTPRHQTPPAISPQAGAGFQAGIAVDPGERLTILFPAQSGAKAVVSLADGGDVMVRAIDGATFTSDVDRLLIEHRAVPAPRYEIQIPRAAPWVEIQVGGRRVLLQQSGRIITGVAPDAQGRYRLVLSGSMP
jgi:hypothetical protein